MGIPWILALKAIPWDTILANAPGILRSADALLSETKVRPPAAAFRNDIQALVDRVAVLEQRDRETAELLTRISTQVSALTIAVKVLESAGTLAARRGHRDVSDVCSRVRSRAVRAIGQSISRWM